MRNPLKTFYNMRSRCYNPKDIRYKSYGGRGITICEKWLRNPVSFATWAENNGYAPGKEIHRINNATTYSPDTCEFLTVVAHAQKHSMPAVAVSNRTVSDPGLCTCLRCGATWTPRTEKPVQCPRCKRVDWDKKK